MIPIGNRVIGVGDFKINQLYVLNCGYYRGQVVKLEWISTNKPIFLEGKHHRQISVILINDQNKKIVSQLNHLSVRKGIPNYPSPPVVVKLTTNNPFKNLSNKNLIHLAVKSDNRKVLQEYIRRFKKKPKFKR